jgi:predicted transcriptional regulator
MKKTDVLNRVLNSESSIFSKDDVVRLIEEIDVELGLTPNQIEKILDELENTLDFQANHNGLVDYDTAELSLDGNEISLQNVDVNISSIISHAREAFSVLDEE